MTKNGGFMMVTEEFVKDWDFEFYNMTDSKTKKEIWGGRALSKYDGDLYIRETADSLQVLIEKLVIEITNLGY